LRRNLGLTPRFNPVCSEKRRRMSGKGIPALVAKGGKLQGDEYFLGDVLPECGGGEKIHWDVLLGQ